MPSSRKASPRADETTLGDRGNGFTQRGEGERGKEIGPTAPAVEDATESGLVVEAGGRKRKQEAVKVATNEEGGGDDDDDDATAGLKRGADHKNSIADTLRKKFDEIDDLLKKSQDVGDEEEEKESKDAANSSSPENNESLAVGSQPVPSAPPAPRRKKPFSCYNCIIFIMDATLLILSLLYPVLIKSRSKFTFAEQTVDGGSIASGAHSRSSGDGAAYVRASPRSFFRHGSPWHNLLVEDIFDGDLATLKSHVGGADWTLVFYYASWDADSMEARKAFVNAASAAVVYSGVRFAAINCRWRHGSCWKRATKIRSFPAVYAYDARFRGFIYQGSHDEDGYLAFLDRLIHPFRHLKSVSQLSTLVATRDTVILAYLDASAAAFNASLTMRNSNGTIINRADPFRAFYDAAVHFAQAPHFLSFQFLLVTSPTLAEALEFTAAETLHLYRSMDSMLAYNISASSASGLIAALDRNAASASVALVSKSHYHQPLVTRLTSTNVSVLLFGPGVRSPRTFHPAYQEFRELVTWFRACGSNYHRAFKDIIASSEERFEAQHFCCDYSEEGDFYFDASDEVVAGSPFEGRTAKPSYFAPHSPKKSENQICRLKASSPSSMTTVSVPVALNFSRSCGGVGGRGKRASPLPPPSYDAATNRHWARRCQQYLENPSLCRRRLTKTAGGVVQDGVLAVPAFAGLSCRTNRTFGFRYVVKKDFPQLARRFGLDDDEGVASIVVLDNDSEESFVLRRVEKSKEMGDFIANFSGKTSSPYRRSGAAGAKGDAEKPSHERCLKKNGFSALPNRTSASPPPSSFANATKSCVLELSSDSLRSLLREGDGEALILFYTKTCGLCKTFGRYFLRLSKLFRDAAGFRLARIDVDENDLPINLTVGSVPAIIFFRGVNFSRAFRPGDDGHLRRERRLQRPFSAQKPSSSSRPRLSLPDLLSFVLRHVKSEVVRRKFASKLCDATCLKNNLEDVRKSAAEFRWTRDRLVDAMLVINQRVNEAEKEMLYHVERCAPTEGSKEGKDEDDGSRSEPVPDVCRLALEELTKRVQGFARRLDVKGRRLGTIERKLKTLTKMEAKIAWALYKQK